MPSKHSQFVPADQPRDPALRASVLSVAGLLLPVLLLACSSISPHENFLQGLHSKIGQNIDSLSPYWTHQEDLIDTTSLPNGNVEYRYKYFGTCRYIFEVNPSTRVIVGARYEGKETDCVINP